MWTVDRDDLVVRCEAAAVKRLIVVGSNEAIGLCAAHGAEVAQLPTVDPADDETLIMRWA